MAETTISALPAVTVPAGTDVFPVDQGGVTKKETVAQALAGAGGVVGPGSSTDTAIALFSGTTGKVIQNSTVTVNASGTMTFPSGQSISLPGASFVAANSFNGTAVQFKGGNGTNIISLQSGESAALTVTDGTAPNGYLTIDTTVGRPQFAIDCETTISGPTGSNYMFWALGGDYNGPGSLTASQSGTTVTGVGTTFPTTCAGGYIYWPSTGNIAVVVSRDSATQLTVTPSQTQAGAKFNLYYQGIYYGYDGVKFLQSGASVLVNTIDTPPTAVGIGTSMTIGGTNATAITLGSTAYPLTVAINRLLYASSANTVVGLATANSSILTTNGSGVPSWSTTVPSGLTGAALTEVNDTNVTLTLGGSPTTALLNAASITAGWSGQLSLTRGGTNASLTASNGGIFYSTGTAGAILAGTATANQVLLSGASTTPAWSTATYPATAGTAGKVLISDGTNIVSSTPTFPNASAASGKFIRSDGTNWIASTPTLPTTGGASGTVLTSDGTNFVNTTATYPGTATSTGVILRADGTNWSATTATYPSTTTANQLLYSSATNTVGGLATANSSVLVTSSGGAPSLSTTIPKGVTITGSTSGSSPAAGAVGEVITSTIVGGSAVPTSNNTATNVTSLSLTAGNWLVYGNVVTGPAGSTTTTNLVAAINTTSASLPSAAVGGYMQLPSFTSPAGQLTAFPTGSVYYSFASTTTVYLIAYVTFAVSTMGTYGTITAIRMP